MENSGSGDSSPLSREIDCDTPPAWDDPPSKSCKVKFMCSYGGKIQPRAHDNQLSYVGGDTKILSVDRNATFSAVLSKLSSLSELSAAEICLKYQLPGEDLDALISVTNDEDLEYMMSEYDRLNRSSPKPARLRIFLFTANSKAISVKENMPEGKWFVDALNSVQLRAIGDDSSPTPVPELVNPDFLFGFDKVGVPNPNSANNVSDMNNQVDDGEPVASVPREIERFRIVDGEMRKLYEDVNPNSNAAMVFQKVSPAPQVQLPIPADYWPERPVAGAIPADQQPVYVVQTPAGAIYHQNASMQPAAGQSYYSFPRMQPVAGAAAAPPPVIPQSVRQSQFPPAPTMAVEHGYTQMSYDNAGRPVYYTLAGGGFAPPQSYQPVNTASAAAAGGNGAGTDSKGVGGGMAPQTTSSAV